MPAFNQLATKLYNAQQTFDQVVHFVHIYVVEPHPQRPDESPYGCRVWEANYSSKSQPRTYAQRVANAQDMVTALQGNHLMLIDEMSPLPHENPVWCTYGPCPNCAYLIRQDGTVAAVQNWANASGMENSITTLLSNN